VDFPSYTERDFLERDLRKVNQARKDVEGVLQAQPGLGADELEDMIIERAGISAIRYREVKHFQRRKPQRAAS
jgi:hypothetical protein